MRLKNTFTRNGSRFRSTHLTEYDGCKRLLREALRYQDLQTDFGDLSAIRVARGEAKEGNEDYYKEVSGSDQKNTAWCEVVVSGDPLTRSSLSCSPDPSSNRTVAVWTFRGEH